MDRWLWIVYVVYRYEFQYRLSLHIPIVIIDRNRGVTVIIREHYIQHIEETICKEDWPIYILLLTLLFEQWVDILQPFWFFRFLRGGQVKLHVPKKI